MFSFVFHFYLILKFRSAFLFVIRLDGIELLPIKRFWVQNDKKNIDWFSNARVSY